MMRISQLAGRCGVPATTLRYYERAGLLPAARGPSGYRLFGEDAVARLAFIGATKRLGLPLEEIAELLAVWASGRCREVKADLRPRVAAHLAEAHRRLAELTALITTLRETQARLDALPDRDGACDEACGDVLPSKDRAGGAPVACALDGAGMEDRMTAWREALDGGTRTPVDGGMRVTVPVERAAAVAGLAAAEQECCPFLAFDLRLADGTLNLEVRGPAEASGLVAEAFGRPTVP